MIFPEREIADEIAEDLLEEDDPAPAAPSPSDGMHDELRR